MGTLIRHVAEFISAHAIWAGPIAGLISFGESLVLVGILLPGTAVLIIVGGFIGSELIEPLPIVLGAALGAILGDTVSYFLGPLLGRRLFYRWPLNRYK